MTLPYREWLNPFVVSTVCRSADNQCISIGRWTEERLFYGNQMGKLGHYTIGANDFIHYHTLAKPFDNGFELAESLDEIIDFGFSYTISLDTNTSGSTQFDMYSFSLADPTAPNSWNKSLVNGKYYDGTNPWTNYPPGTGHNYFDQPTFLFVNLPASGENWIEAYDTGCHGNQEQENLFRNGIRIVLSNYDAGTPFPVGQATTAWIQIQRIRVNYLNPVVNSVSISHMRSAGGVEMVLTGLGFDQDDNEIADPARYSGNDPTNAWNSMVDYIDFIGKQGQGTTSLDRVAGDFIVDSDTQITILSMPALDEGTYDVRLRKVTVGPASCVGNVAAYVGDWRADDDGRVHEGARLAFLVSDVGDAEELKGSMFFSKWAFKAKDGSQVFQYWAPIDVRSTDRFYDGRLISESGITRSIDDRSGLPNISDMAVDVAVDKELRQILAEYFLKNQFVELYFGWANQPEAWKQNIMTMIVDDHDTAGDVLKATLKDVSQKYFRISIPRYLITLNDYPNAHESAIGQPMPEAIGLCSKTTDPPGATWAPCVNTITFKYLAARGSLHAVTEVYSDDVLQIEGAGNDYTISYEDGGRTYINFNADQGNKRVRFNCEGYMFALWNSVNGYVQNPAYVIAFLFAFIAEVPGALLDLEAVDAVATIFEDRSEGESGYWIGQNSQPLENAIHETNFTFGVKVWPDREGRFTFGIKDLTNWRSGTWIFEQVDALKPSTRKENLREAMNYVKALYGSIPTSSSYLGSTEADRPSLIEDYEAQIEAADSPWKFPWTTSADLVSKRILDELYKRGNGIKEIHFLLPIDWIFMLDIFDSFIYQNPFAPTLSGEGQQQWYYYVKSLSYNFVNNTIDVIGIDLQWLIRQCFIIGRCEDMAESWMDATEEMRLFGYVGICDAVSGNGCAFPDGEPCKKICPC